MVMTDATSPPMNDDDLDVDRELPREEKKFEMINTSKTLTTVNENQSDFNDTLHALNRDPVISSFQRVAELGQTAKRDEQVATLSNEMRRAANQPDSEVEAAMRSSYKAPTNADCVFNPFSSNAAL